MDKCWNARWIINKRFEGLSPINVFYKQQHPPSLPEHRSDLKNLHTLFRKTFSLTARNIRSAFLDISADDYYKLYINKQSIGQGPAPSYHFHYYYNRYDVSEFLTPGKNVLAVHVYYQGLINRVWNSGDYRQGLIAELFINNELCIATDASWKYLPAQEFTGTETTGYDTQYLEHIDNRLKQTGWQNVEYDDSCWKHVCECQTDDHTLFLQPTPPLEVYEITPPVVKNVDNGQYFIDFGQEITGQFKMQARGEAGQVIEIRCGEELEGKTDSHVKFHMRCNCTYQEYWTLSGGLDMLEHYDYKAFRYVEILDPDQTVNPESFCAVVRHYPFDDDVCTFESSNPLLNTIWAICKSGVKYGSQEVYVDCPSREKGQYLGDAVITAQSHSYLTGDLRLWKKSLQDFALSTSICPGMMAVAPGSFMQEIADFSLLWPLHLLKYYRQSGDHEFLAEMYPTVERLMTYFSQYQRQDGLLENVKDKWNLVDWPDNLRDGYDFDLSEVVGDGCHNVINAFYCGAVKTINAIRDLLQIDYEDQFPALKQAFINAFYNPQTGLFLDSTTSKHSALHSNTLALFYDLVPDEAVKSVIELIKQKRFSCGVYHAYFLLKGLARADASELVYDLLTSEDEFSWANMIREGATTCFEAWGKDQKWNTSLCHPWASAPITVLIEDIIGLKPAKPGWEEISFTPHIPKSLRHITLEIPTVQGKIQVNCTNETVNIQTPCGVSVVKSEIL
jgi:alpha-L-rhamnosidase